MDAGAEPRIDLSPNRRRRWVRAGAPRGRSRSRIDSSGMRHRVPAACSGGRAAVAITKDDVVALMNAFHNLVMFQKGTAAEQADFFLHPDPWIHIPHGEDISLGTNYAIHQQLTDESHTILEPMDVTALASEPERARAVGAVLWEGRPVGSPGGGRRRRRLDRATRAVGRPEDRPLHQLVPPLLARLGPVHVGLTIRDGRRRDLLGHRGGATPPHAIVSLLGRRPEGDRR